VESGDAIRASQRELVRHGYDTISLAYRSEDGQAAPASAEDVSRYQGWVAGLAELLPPRATLYLLAIVGAERWTGTEPYLGAPMFWDVAGTDDYLRWLRGARLTPLWNHFIPEGASGHCLILARAD
jgi:hypothetical protein